MMSQFVLSQVTFLFLLLVCGRECLLYCVITSNDVLCPCQNMCITLEEISTNSTGYIDSNTTLILQPGNHTLNSNLSVSNISFFKLHSDEPSETRIVCKPSAGLYFLQVSTIEVIGIEFTGCERASIFRAENFNLRDSTLVSENGNSKGLVLKETVAARITNCLFEGVAIYIIQQSFVTVNNISISSNTANLAALAVYDSTAEFRSSTVFTNNQGGLLAHNANITFLDGVTFSDCSMTNNGHYVGPSVGGGGAISSFQSDLTFQGNITFINNRANYGGAIYAVESAILFTTNGKYLTDSTASKIGTVMTIVNNTASISGGAMYLYRSTMVVRNADVQITENSASEKGGGIHLAYSDIKMEAENGKNASLVVAGNSAQFGGGMHLEGFSRLRTQVTNTLIKLIDNSADNGAAIFVDDNTKYGTCVATTGSVNFTPEAECFIGVHGLNTFSKSMVIYNQELEESLVAWNNTAKSLGPDLFGGLLDRCIPSSANNAITASDVSGEHTSGSGLAYFKNLSNINTNMNRITSLPVRVCICTQNLPDCNFQSPTRKVLKGQPFIIPVTAVDQVGAPVNANILAYISSAQASLRSGDTIQPANGCTNLSYAVFSSGFSEDLNLYADGPCRNAERSQLTVALDFSTCNCPAGFQINTTNNETSCECICDPLIYPEYISSCSLQPEPLIERRPNAWIDPFLDDESNRTSYIVANMCPFRYCLGQSSIKLASRERTRAQCIPGRDGTLCTGCSIDYSFALSGKRCVQCPELWPLLLIVIILGGLLAGVGLVVLIMSLNLTVAVGTINGFIFYANIIDVYDVVFLPFTKSNFPEILIEWLNLDPGIDICFVPGYAAYPHLWVRFLFPLYIIFIIVVISEISSCSVRFSTVIGKRNPIAVLATLVLLSYANFLQSALLILTPATLTTVSSAGSQMDTVWFLDGDVKYLHGKHIPLFIVALVIILLAIVYNIIIFSWQWIVRLPKLKWTNNQKLNSFILTYQAPFNDRHRYWTGLLLLLRLLLTLILSFTASSDPNISIIALILSLGMLFLLRLTYAKNLYKKWPADLLETVLIFNLFTLGILAYTYNDDNTRQTLAYISVSFTFFLLIVVMAYHVYAYILVSVCPKLERDLYTFTSNTQQDVASRTPGDGIYSQDRFFKNVGTSELLSANIKEESTPSKITRIPKKQKVPHKVTHSVVTLSDLREEVNEGDNFEAPYRGLDEINSGDSDRGASSY